MRRYRRGIPFLRTLPVVWVLALAASLTGTGPSSGQERQLDRLPSGQRLQVLTHYRQGLELARLYQLERALAEFESALRLLPDHHESMLQKSRMLLGLGRAKEASGLLSELVAQVPGSLAAHMLLRDLHRAGGPLPEEELFQRHTREIEELSRGLGDFDLTLRSWLEKGEGPDPKTGLMSRYRADRVDRAGLQEDPLLRLAGIYLLREGAPVTRAVVLDHNLRADRAIHGLLREYPGLCGIALEHGQYLLMSQIRFDLVEDPELPPMDSSITLDIAQMYFEYALDLSLPSSFLAYSALLNLGHVARDMGDFLQARQLYEVLLDRPDASEDLRVQAYFNLGVIHLREGDREPARARFEESAALREDSIIRWFLSLTGGEKLKFRQEPVAPELKGTLEFDDVAADLGVDKYDGAGPSAWCDTDRDGDLDLFVCGCDTFCILYRNDGSRFTDVSREAGLEDVASGFSSTFADYDNDGDCDLYIGRNGWSGPAPNSLFQNQGDGTFKDVTATAGVGDPGSTFVHAWADFDRDGYLDLYMANGITRDGSTNTLYRNRGDGTFVDFTREAGLSETPGTQTIGFGIGDYNKDGWPDIFVNSWSTRNRLYRNQGGAKFVDVATFAGVDGQSHPSSGYLGFLNDFDNDSWPDILLTKLCPSFGMTIEGMLDGFEPTRLTNLYTSKLYRNRGDGWSFEDVSAEAGLIYAHGSMGGNVGDLNNDGYLDFYLGTGDPWLPRMEANALYINAGDGSFVDLTRSTGLGHLGKGHGITFADYDFDGDLDIYAPQGGFVHGDLWRNVFYRNQRGNRNNWLQVLLEGRKSNRMGIGAQVTLKAGASSQYRESTAGGAFGSSSTPYLHFGLGREERVDLLEVRWPSGELSSFEGVAANQFIKLTEGEDTIEILEPGNAEAAK